MYEKILVYKISRSEADSLDIDLPDFDAITTELPPGLYTTFRTYAGRTKVLGLRSHLERLYLPAKAQGIVPTVRRPDDFRQVLFELLSRFDAPEARVRLILDSSVEPGTMYVLLQALRTLPDDVYENGVHLEISRSSREKPSLKRTTFINETTLERKRIGGEIFELLLTDKGRILEGMTSNFFYVREGVLCTAGRGVLIGVTRQTVITLAKREGMKFCIRALRVNELPSISEAFITSSSRGIVPVVGIDARQVGDGNVGPATRRLLQLYNEEVLALAEEIIPELPKV
ncbi:MAG TPA: aminotransferase class IV [Anaerolineales bacterium]|nr:aminotransferase class IV [Anaerolineales bacterium]